MDRSYEIYCLADPHFYDTPLRGRQDDPDFSIARREVPNDWTRVELDDWLAYYPAAGSIPPQGWKVHVSATLDNAEAVLAEVFEYCVRTRLPFKFVRSLQLMLLRNSKYADRASSGKFATLYPSDEDQLAVVLEHLGPRLEGQAGPYILSDLRWGAGPLYVRYGGFAERYCIGPDGEPALAIEDPDGTLVPDQRGSTFLLPTWVELPAVLVPHLAARNRATVDDMPYRIEGAMHFSNGGGLYEAVDARTGTRVVLKEARPHAGLATDRSDAVERLGREHSILEQLAGLDVVPEVRDRFTLGEHHFLVEAFVEGESLNTLLVEQYPLVSAAPDAATLAAYTEWALAVHRRLEVAVASIHERGVVIGDLHPSNVIVRPDGSVVLVDFEVASDVREGRRPTIADPGFMPPADRSGFDIDEYSLACMRLFLFLPLPTLVTLAPAKAEEFATVITDTFPVPPEFVQDALRVIAGRDGRSDQPSPRPARAESGVLDLADAGGGWSRARDSMALAIAASATPDREDRLFPGDPRQFGGGGGGLNMAHGAAGVLYALAAAGAPRRVEHEDWLVRHALSPEPGTNVGFYDGLHGVAYALDHLDRRPDALKLVDICTTELAGKLDRLGLDLQSGLAGVGLNLAYFADATGEPALFDAAALVTDMVADRLGTETSVPEISGGEHPFAGLLRGSSGPALLFLRRFDQTGDAALLDLAATALRQDLRRCVARDDGAIAVNEGWRAMPYLADGSVGIGLVIDEYLARRDDSGFRLVADGIRTAAEAQFFIEPGLFYGRAGIILYLSRRAATSSGDGSSAAAQVQRLAWHAMTFEGQLAFPGDQLLRLSMDLATGTAGVLLAVAAAAGESTAQLPLLELATERR